MLEPRLLIKPLPGSSPGLWRGAMIDDLFDTVIRPEQLGVKAGTAGWTNPALARAGAFYPKGLKTAAGRLQFYARNFNLVEVDSSFYHLPSRRNSQLWAERTPPGFTFNVKAFAAFTRHPFGREAVPGDLIPSLPLQAREKERLYESDLGSELVDELWFRFREALLPLQESGRLGVVLFQFPKWFPRGRANRDYLASLPARLRGVKIAVEFRQHTWLDPAHRDDTLAFLREHGLLYVTVDEPQGYASSVPLVPAATGDLALFRLHGRNTDNWDRRGAGVEERFRYLYPVDELSGFLPVIRQLKDSAPEVHIVFNNCYGDYAVRNVRQLLALMAGKEST